MNYRCTNDEIDIKDLTYHYNLYKTVEDNGILLVTLDVDYFKYIISLDSLMFKLDNNKVKKSRYVLFCSYVHGYSRYEDYINNTTISPYAFVFFKTCDKHNLKGDNRFWLENDLGRVNSFVNDLLLGMKESDFKRKIRNKRKYVSKNKISLEKYIDSLFDYRSKLLVIRLDTHYVNIDKDSYNYNIAEVDDKTIINHRDEFIKRIKKVYDKGLIGYVWKLEYGIETGYHIHFLFFLDGSKHQQDITIGKMLGELWKNNITNGKGRYWNCNQAKAKFEKNGKLGIGEIHRDDKVKINNLKSIATYLVKVDRFVQTVLPNKARIFGKGQSPKRTRL